MAYPGVRFLGGGSSTAGFFIIGYDDAPDVEFSDPTLTTIRQPMQEAGKTAARLLLQMIEDPEGTLWRRMFDTELATYSSYACLPLK